MKNELCKFLKQSLMNNFSNIFTHFSKFSVIFPKYQERFIRESWDMINRILNSYRLDSQLDLKFGLIEVANNKNTIDPYVLIKARDFLRLISRSVPLYQAAKIFDDNIYCDIINISKKILNRKKFLKRRKRLIGNKGTIIKSIEILTQCYILVQGNTVSCMGKHSGLKIVRTIIDDCMDNIHPVLHLKRLIVKRELSKDFRFINKNWESFLPGLKKKKNLIPFKRKYILSNNKNYTSEKSIFYNYENNLVKFNQNNLNGQLKRQILESYNIINFN